CSEQEWQARGWDWVDPLKDSKAATESIANRTKSRGYYIRLNGDDPDEVFEEIEAEEQLLREKGLLADPKKTEKEQPYDGREEAADDE
ncbi:phage portal protein, partial [Bradyrhizobium sp. CSA112]|nr:phage portal protein [Bradyrhizobium sp. CSA112]